MNIICNSIRTHIHTRASPHSILICLLCWPSCVFSSICSPHQQYYYVEIPSVLVCSFYVCVWIKLLPQNEVNRASLKLFSILVAHSICTRCLRLISWWRKNTMRYKNELDSFQFNPNLSKCATTWACNQNERVRNSGGLESTELNENSFEPNVRQFQNDQT